ncbi:acyl carrier protein [Nostoc sp. 2RC]|uniref:acyl carrier protein n=1 Tax=Nostoc sp. 2RC TaxID=2485484 RepID=UPI00162871A9|nr:acyl carrier protein [Nostoc sp. 2RC]MBC1239983.1 acyl carrier protein [Nostoc sp. 2RC]
MELQYTSNSNWELNDNQREKLLSIIYAHFDFDDKDSQVLEFNDDTLIKSLPGFDSLKVFQVLGKIELEFFIDLGFTALEQVKTMGDLYTIVAQAIEKKQQKSNSK